MDTETRKQLKADKLRKEQTEFTLSDLRRSFGGPPVRVFKVGERVRYGSFKETYVREVLDNGRIYLIEKKSVETKHGEKVFSTSTGHVLWTDLEPYDHAALFETESLIVPDHLQINYSQRDISSLLHCYYRFGIETEMDYQRGNVWEVSDQQRLIESVFRHVDIGKFVLIRRPYGAKGPLFEILDGKQRLTALLHFKEGRFTYRGKTFFDLFWRDRVHFGHYPIVEGTVEDRAEKPITDAYKYAYFLKLNTYGHVVAGEHIRYVENLLEKALKKED